VALARGLVLHHGCEVTIVTEVCWKQFVKDARRTLPPGSVLRFLPIGGDTTRKLQDGITQLFLRNGQDWDALQALMFSRSEVEFFPSEGCIHHWARVERPDFIVFGFTLVHVAMIISESLQIPIVGFIFQWTQEIEPRANPDTLVDEIVGPMRLALNASAFNSVLRQVMERIPSRTTPTLNALRTTRGLAPCPGDISASSYQDRELRHQQIPRIVPVCPAVLGGQAHAREMAGLTLTDFVFLRQETDGLDSEVDQFIGAAREKGRKIVVVTFSSMPVGEQGVLRLAAHVCRCCVPPPEGLERHRRPAVIALVGGQEHDPAAEGLLEECRGLEAEGRLLRLSRAVSFGSLFPRVDAAVLHGGLGVTSEALRAGIPVITSGILLMDQRYWAARISELGCGPRGVPFAQLLRSGSPREDGQPRSLVVELLEKALAPASEGSWSAKAAELKQKLGDSDGVEENARAVFEAGAVRPQQVTRAYMQRCRCVRTWTRQVSCGVSCVVGCFMRWLLCSQVPACLRLPLSCARRCICRPLRRLCFRCFSLLYSRASGAVDPLLPSDSFVNQQGDDFDSRLNSFANP